MNKEYAELILYHGICPADGFGEGWFPIHSSRGNFSEKAIISANQLINRYLETRQEMIQVVNNEGGILHSEEESQEFYNQLKKQFASSDYRLRPCSSMHGKLSFDRFVLIDGVLRIKKEELTDFILE